MTVGPFDKPLRTPDSEYGGGDGIVEDHPDHEPTSSEWLGMAHRTNPSDAEGIDPVTGRPVPPG